MQLQWKASVMGESISAAVEDLAAGKKLDLKGSDDDAAADAATPAETS